jgi:hypothetical protein
MDEQEAREAAEKWRFITKAWTHGYFGNISPADIQAGAEREIRVEDVFKEWIVSSDPKIHLKAIKELTDIGTTHIVVHVGSANQLENIDFFGREVLPAIGKGTLVLA